MAINPNDWEFYFVRASFDVWYYGSRFANFWFPSNERNADEFYRKCSGVAQSEVERLATESLISGKTHLLR